ncbi:hypothetical protein SB822_51330, partial [Paraburkholderia sp. SIMBA_054]
FVTRRWRFPGFLHLSHDLPAAGFRVVNFAIPAVAHCYASHGGTWTPDNAEPMKAAHRGAFTSRYL